MQRISEATASTIGKIGYWLFAVLTIALFALMFAHGRSVVVPELFRGDFDLYYFGAVAEQHGSYTSDSYVIELAKQSGRFVPTSGVFGAPALIAFVFMPLTALDVHTAEVVWDIAMAVLVLLATRAAAGKNWALILVALLATHSMLSGMQYGNASLLTFSLIAFAYAAARDDKPVATGILIGVATAFKVYPAFLIVALLVHKNWKAAGWAIATAVGLTLAAIPILGFRDFCDDAARIVGLGSSHRIWSDNNSLAGIVAFATHSYSLGQLTSVIAPFVGVYVIWRFRSQQPEITLAIAVGVMLLTQALAWGHYYTVTLLLLIAVLSLTESTTLKAAAVVSYLLAGLPSIAWPNPDLPPGIVKVAALIVLVMCVIGAERVPAQLPARQDDQKVPEPV